MPQGYRVVRVGAHSRTCVRLDRRVVYLGGAFEAEQRCPAGRDPRQAPRDRRRRRTASASARRRPRSRAPRPASSPAPPTPAAPRATASVSGSVFTGLGFDTCSAPSSKAMAAWAESPFRGVGIYIGGENSACSQPNLSASWVSAQTTAGWHLIPTYVGLQAPTSSCSSCAKMTTVAAGTQGTAAAEDAVAEATAIGIGAGSPIYFDMESYSPTTSATKAVLTFLEAWTNKLHELGYQSGVYSSSGSGIADLADQLRHRLRAPRRHLDRQLEQRRKTRSTRWCRQPPGPTTSASTSTAAATTTPTAASRSTSTATTSTGRRSGSARRRSANRTRSARSN